MELRRPPVVWSSAVESVLLLLIVGLLAFKNSFGDTQIYGVPKFDSARMGCHPPTMTDPPPRPRPSSVHGQRL